MTILDAALHYETLGWSVLPLCPPDHVGVGKEHRGCKSPGKRPFFPGRSGSGDWKANQTVRATPKEIREWWDRHPRLNVGVALGPVSGLVGIDVDDEEGDTLLGELSGGDLPATWEYTTGKGRRLLYQLPPGVQVVNHAFRRPGTEIEILRFMSGGGQVVLPPSIHPNGSTYTWKSLRGPDDLPLADAPEWLRGEGRPKTGDARRPADGELISEGGRNNYLTSLAGAMRKRGADEAAILAALESTNQNRCDPPLADSEIQTIARSICRYAPDDFSGVSFKLPDPNRTEPVTPGGRKFKWASELTAPVKGTDWIWDGYLPRGGITLLSALWKAGKTTLLAHLLRSLGTDGSFLGRTIHASRVLYVSEEGEQHWVRRRDDLSIGDNAGFYLQPFAAKPNPADWIAFVNNLKADVEEHRFDLVIFDTLAKLWPVVEENDAGSVDAALMPLWNITKSGAGVLLIHHLRKSGGAEYTASRGSGALSAFPDILIELTRFDAMNARDRKRTLRAKGRYEETPDEIIIELVDNEYRDVTHNEIGPDGRVVIQAPVTEEDRILAILGTEPEVWLTADGVANALRDRGWGMRRADVTTNLTSLCQRDLVVYRGTVRSKNEPREYRLATRPDLNPPPGVNGNETLAGGMAV